MRRWTALLLTLVLALGLTILITQSILRQFARKEDAPLANPD